MNEKELIAVRVGDVPVWLADEGLELAVAYFEDNDINALVCFEAKKYKNNSELAMHWDKAEKMSNRVLLSDARYDNSMISLDFEVF